MTDQSKPARLRVLELPTQVDGDDVRTPYLLVVDRCEPELAATMQTANSEAIQASTGARGLIAFGFEVDLEC